MSYHIRPITHADNPAVARVIRTVMPEFGASGPGFSINDPEVDAMHEAYDSPQSEFFVVTREDAVMGCGGVAPLADGDPGTCELRKMYFLPEVRGQGAGRELLALCLRRARVLGFTYCYLETLGTMHAAHRLYERAGFERLPGPIGSTGHFKCDAFYGIALTAP
ncbi:MAG: GNAT family N-acetyltransferase [Gemmatimonadales bacterium]